MEELEGMPTGKQCYVLTQEDRDESRTIQTTLVVMTEVFCHREDLDKHMIVTKPARSDIKRFFADMSAKISRAMDGARKND